MPNPMEVKMAERSSRVWVIGWRVPSGEILPGSVRSMKLFCTGCGRFDLLFCRLVEGIDEDAELVELFPKIRFQIRRDQLQIVEELADTPFSGKEFDPKFFQIFLRCDAFGSGLGFLADRSN